MLKHRMTHLAGFTLIELLIVIAIIAVLLALLMPAVSIVKLRAMKTETRMFTGQLAMSLETYSNEDRRHEYPLQGQLYPTPTITIPYPFSTRPQGVNPALLNLLRSVGVNSGPRLFDDAGCMLDPWGGRYSYQLTRPTPALPVGALKDWNWDSALGRSKRWNERADTAAPFPYVWSLGKDGVTTDATSWIYETNL